MAENETSYLSDEEWAEQERKNQEEYDFNSYGQFLSLYDDWKKGGTAYKDSIEDSNFNQETYSKKELGNLDFNFNEGASVKQIKERALENLFYRYDQQKEKNNNEYNESLDTDAVNLFQKITFDVDNEEDLLYNANSLNEKGYGIDTMGHFAKSDLLKTYVDSNWFARTEEDKKREKVRFSDEFNDHKEDLITQAEYIADKNDGKVGKYDLETIKKCIDNLTLSPSEFGSDSFDVNNKQHRDEALFYNFINEEYKKTVTNRNGLEKTADVLSNSYWNTASLIRATFADYDDNGWLEKISDDRRKANLLNPLLETQSISQITGMGSAFEYVANAIGSQFFNAAWMLAAGAPLTALGVPPNLAAGLAAGVLNYGEAKLDQYEDFGKVDLGPALVQATGYSALDAMTGGFVGVLRRTATQTAKQTAKEILVGLSKRGTISAIKTTGNVLKQIGKGGVKEGVTETMQSGVVGRSVHAYLDENNSFLKKGETTESAIVFQLDEFFAGMFGSVGGTAIATPMSLPSQIKLVKQANDVLRSTVEMSMSSEELAKARAEMKKVLSEENKGKEITEEDIEKLPSAIRLQLLMQSSPVQNLGAGDRVALFLNIMDAESINDAKLGIELVDSKLGAYKYLLDSAETEEEKNEISKKIEDLNIKRRKYERNIEIASQGYSDPLKGEGNIFSRAKARLGRRKAQKLHQRRRAMSEPVREIYNKYTSKYNGEPLFAEDYTENDYVVNGKDLRFKDDKEEEVVNQLLAKEAMASDEEKAKSPITYTDADSGITFQLEKDGISVIAADNMRLPSGESFVFSFDKQAGGNSATKKANAISAALDTANKLIAYNNRYNANLAQKVKLINDYASARRLGTNIVVVDNLAALEEKNKRLKKQLEAISADQNSNEADISKLQDEIEFNTALLNNALPGKYAFQDGKRGGIYILAERISSPLTLAMKLNHELFHERFRDFIIKDLMDKGIINDEMSQEEQLNVISDEVKKHKKINEAGAIVSELKFAAEPNKIRRFLSNFGALGRKIADLPDLQLMEFQRNILNTPPYIEKINRTKAAQTPWSFEDVLEEVSMRNLEQTENKVETIEDVKANEGTATKEETSEENNDDSWESLGVQQYKDGTVEESQIDAYNKNENKIKSLKVGDEFVSKEDNKVVATVSESNESGIVIDTGKTDYYIFHPTKESPGYVNNEEVVEFLDESKYSIGKQENEVKEEPAEEKDLPKVEAEQEQPTKVEEEKSSEPVVEQTPEPIAETKEESKEEEKPKEEQKAEPKKEESKEESPTPSTPKKNNRFKIHTPDNELEIEGEYRVVDASELTDMEGTAIQNRIRAGNRNAEMQEMKIGTDLNPNRLMESATSEIGSPIVDAKGHIISGHGRTHGIQHAYENNLADNYKNAILEKAKELGVSVDKNIKNPILVRVLDNIYTEEQLVDIASRSNQPSLASKTPVEVAISDSTIIDSNKDMIYLLNPDEEGNMLSNDNVEFMRAFASGINDTSIRNQDGTFTEKADSRAKNAVLAYLFKDYPNKFHLLTNIFEKANTLKMKRLVAGVLKAAPAIINATLIKAQTDPDFNVAGFLGKALDEFVKYRQGVLDGKYKSAEEYVSLNSISMFNEFEATPEDVLFAFKMLNEYSNSAIDIFNFLTKYAELVINDPGKSNLFGDESRTPLQLMEFAKEETDKLREERKNGLFSDVNFATAGEIGAARLDELEGVTTRMDNLSKAKEMTDAKIPEIRIKWATGWELGADGKWRLEDDNVEMKDTQSILDIVNKKKESKKPIYLSNIIADNNVVRAYPQLKNVVVQESSTTEYLGGAMPKSKQIWLPLDLIESNPDLFKSVLNHEVQHFIQYEEGFATGGNPDDFDSRYSNRTKRRKYESLMGEVEARNVADRALYLTDEERRNTLLSSTEKIPRNKQLLNVEQGDKKKQKQEKPKQKSTNKPAAALENSEIVEKQKQLNEIIKQIDDLKNSDVANTLLKKAYEGDDVGGYAKWAESSGLNDLISNRQALQKEIADAMAKARKEYEEKAKREEEEAIKRSGLSEADYFRKQAIKEFGYTPYFVDGGYILPNGRMLNFSGEKGKHFGIRGQDHRAIARIYADAVGTKAMVRFINEGNIRMMPESPGVEISNVHKPSSEQYKTIRDLAQKYADKDYFFVDFADSNGNVVGSLQYDGYVNPMRVINDIKHFYKTGEIRKPSNIYSFRSDDVNYASVGNITFEGRGKGYIGKSMSVNAAEAYKDGVMPKSKWTKSVIVERVEEINPDIDISKHNLETIQNELLRYKGWHHTSAMFNVTQFYGLDIDYIEKLTQKDIDEWTREQGASATHRDKTYDNIIDDYYSQIKQIVEAGIAKNESKLAESIGTKAFATKLNKAIDKLSKDEKDKFERNLKSWLALPEDHYRHQQAVEYVNNPDKAINEAIKYKGDKLNRNTTLFKTLYKAVEEAEQELNSVTDGRYSIISNYRVDVFDGNKHDIPTLVGDKIVRYVEPMPHVDSSVVDEYKNSVNIEAVEYVRNVLENKSDLSKVKKWFDLSKNISKRLIDAVRHLTGIDIENYKISIMPDAIIHISKRHGIAGKQDFSMSDYNDIGRIGFILNNLDSLLVCTDNNGVVYAQKKVDKNGNKVPVLLARKQINGHFMVANIALNSNKKTIYVLSAYKNKEIPELEANASKNALAITPEATQNLEISFDSIKPNFGTDVNTQSEKKRYSITADPVTYDNNGEIIPLSQRFNASNSDINYSSVDDAIYMDAVNKGDMKTAQEMVDKAARRAGFRVQHMFHSTYFLPGIEPFRVFDPLKGRNYNKRRDEYNVPIFFSTEKDAAKTISYEIVHENPKTPVKLLDLMDEDKVSPYVYDVYIKEDETNLKYLADWEYFDYEDPEQRKFYYNWLPNGATKADKDAVESGDWEYLESPIFQRFLKENGFKGFYTWEFAKNLAVFESNRIKSSAPVTFDENGNVIPLSQRFDMSKNDINYSSVNDGLIDELNRNVSNKTLKEINDFVANKKDTRIKGDVSYQAPTFTSMKKAFVNQRAKEAGVEIERNKPVSFTKTASERRDSLMSSIADKTYVKELEKVLRTDNPKYIDVLDLDILFRALEDDIAEISANVESNTYTEEEKIAADQRMAELKVLQSEVFQKVENWSSEAGRTLSAFRAMFDSEFDIYFIKRKIAKSGNNPAYELEIQKLQKQLEYAREQLRKAEDRLNSTLHGQLAPYLPETKTREERGNEKVGEIRSRVKRERKNSKEMFSGSFDEDFNKLKDRYSNLFTSFSMPTEQDMRRFLDELALYLIHYYPEKTSTTPSFLRLFYEKVQEAWGDEVFDSINSLRDFWDKYGVVPNPKVSPERRRLRELRAGSLWLSKLSDTSKGKASKITGRAHYQMSDEERTYAKIYRQHMLHNPKKGHPGYGLPIQNENVEKEVKAPLTVAKARLENLIKDIDKEISLIQDKIAQKESASEKDKGNIKYTPKSREKIAADKELLFLQKTLKEKKEVRQDLLETLNNNTLSIEDIIKELNEKADKISKKLKNAREGDFPSRAKEKTYDEYRDNPEVAALLNTIATMEDEYQELLYQKNHPELTEEQLIEKTIEKETKMLEKLQKQYENAINDIFETRPIKDKPFAENEKLKALRSEIAKLRENISNLKKIHARKLAVNVNARHARMLSKIEALTQEIENAKAGIVKEKKSNPYADVDKDPLIAKDLAEIKELKKQLSQVLSNDYRTPEEKARDRMYERLQKRIKAYEEQYKLMEEPRKPLEKQSRSTIKKYANDKEYMDAYSKLQEVKKNIKRLAQKLNYENKSLGGKAFHHVKDIGTTIKLIRSSLDASFAWTQCAMLMLRKPKLILSAVSEGMKAAFNPEYAEKLQFEYLNGEDAMARIAAGLRISEIGDTDMTRQEETFSRNLLKSLSHWLNENKITGTILKGSERAFVVPINMLRVLTYDSICEMYGKKPHEMDEATAKTIAKWVNIYTGRGDFYGDKRGLGLFNEAFWAPGLFSAQVQQVTAPIELGMSNATKEDKKLIAKEFIIKPFVNLMLMYGLRMLIWALTKDEDDDEPPVDLNPISTNFLRIKAGDRWISLTGGMEKIISLGAQSIAGKKKNAVGKTVELRGPAAQGRGYTIFNEWANFLHNKVNPFLGIGIDTLEQRARYGEYLLTTEDWLVHVGQNIFVPLPLEDLFTACKEEGVPAGLFYTTLSFVGMKGAATDVDYYERTKNKFEEQLEFYKTLTTSQERNEYVQNHKALNHKNELAYIAKQIKKIKQEERKVANDIELREDKELIEKLRSRRKELEEKFMLLYKAE